MPAKTEKAAISALTQQAARPIQFPTPEDAFYRVRSYVQASRMLTALPDHLARSELPELQTFRTTLLRWRAEILAYFQTRSTNGMTEGFNGKAKLVKRRAYGYKSFANYRLRLLNACA